MERMAYIMIPRALHMNTSRAIHCIARTEDGRDVLICLIAKGAQGLEELDILQHIATSHRAFVGDNHYLPILQTLMLEDMTFGVFPYMETGFTSPWYYNV
ncbi:hypothetical protein PILCRDRAFT_17249 [Piloderma croceum F 1598]|uniref:Uncharacterized protein n=1 Tax=Piloderma croceum (strain F 1598) TaxID=765440 RepID=A0A0C3EF05_PILCF|nr:hypothetical protein PILCRDRAFT_17249 [Piloderma croceum F 1598]